MCFDTRMSSAVGHYAIPQWRITLRDVTRTSNFFRLLLGHRYSSHLLPGSYLSFRCTAAKVTNEISYSSDVLFVWIQVAANKAHIHFCLYSLLACIHWIFYLHLDKLQLSNIGFWRIPSKHLYVKFEHRATTFLLQRSHEKKNCFLIAIMFHFDIYGGHRKNDSVVSRMKNKITPVCSMLRKNWSQRAVLKRRSQQNECSSWSYFKKPYDLCNNCLPKCYILCL